MFSIRIEEGAVLELLQEQHALDLFALVDRNRAYLRRWLAWLDHNTSVDQSVAFIRSCAEQFANRNGFTCCIRFQGAMAGLIGLHFVDWANRKASIGYWIGEEYQGKGLITKSCAAVLDHCFGELGLNCVAIECAGANYRSCAVPERLGFTKEGVLRQRVWLYDHFVDLVSYSLLKAEWKGSTAFLSSSPP